MRYKPQDFFSVKFQVTSFIVKVGLTETDREKQTASLSPFFSFISNRLEIICNHNVFGFSMNLQYITEVSIPPHIS